MLSHFGTMQFKLVGTPILTDDHSPVILIYYHSPKPMVGFVLHFLIFILTHGPIHEKIKIFMAQYFIKLPNNRQGNVKTGIRKKDKKKFVDIFFSSKKLNNEEKIAYIVEVEPVYDISEYRLLKTKEGTWLNEGEDKWLRHGETAFNSAIKKAIDDHEKLNGKPHLV